MNGFKNDSNASINAVVAQVADFFHSVNELQIKRFGYGPRVLPPAVAGGE